MGYGDPRVCGRSHAGGHARHDLEVDPGSAQRLCLLAAAAEHERISALQPHDATSGRPVLEQQPLDLGLRHRRTATLLAGIQELGVGSSAIQRRRRNQAVVDDHVGRRDQLERARRQQARIAWTRRRPGRRSPVLAPMHAADRPLPRRAAAPRTPGRPHRGRPTIDPLAIPSRRGVPPTQTAPAGRRRLHARGLRPGCCMTAPSARTRSRSALTHAVASRSISLASVSGASAPGRPPAPARPGRPREPARQALRRPPSVPAAQPCHRQHKRVVLALGELAQPRVDVAADGHDLDVVAQRADLGRAAQAAGARRAPRRQRRERRCAADRVARIGPLGNRHELEALGKLGRNILGRMHRHVDLAVEQRAFELRDPARLVARSRRAAVARGGDVTSSLSAPSRSATHPACASASALPRVPIRINGVGSRSAAAPRPSWRRRRRPPRRRRARRLAPAQCCLVGCQPEQVAHQRHPGVDSVVAQLLHPHASDRAALD